MKNKYKNISNLDLFVPQVGLVKAGEEVFTEVDINNSNFEKVEKVKITPPKELITEDKNKLN
jgi:hypothetical protein